MQHNVFDDNVGIQTFIIHLKICSFVVVGCITDNVYLFLLSHGYNVKEFSNKKLAVKAETCKFMRLLSKGWGPIVSHAFLFFGNLNKKVGGILSSHICVMVEPLCEGKSLKESL